jgi:hypothetical protein
MMTSVTTMALVLASVGMTDGASNDNPSRISHALQRSRWQTLRSSVDQILEYFRRFDSMFIRNTSRRTAVIWRSTQVFAICGFLTVAYVLGMRLRTSREAVQTPLDRGNSDTASVMEPESANGERLLVFFFKPGLNADLL